MSKKIQWTDGEYVFETKDGENVTVTAPDGSEMERPATAGEKQKALDIQNDSSQSSRATVRSTLFSAHANVVAQTSKITLNVDDMVTAIASGQAALDQIGPEWTSDTEVQRLSIKLVGAMMLAQSLLVNNVVSGLLMLTTEMIQLRQDVNKIQVKLNGN
jgi:hypothetical protein